MMLGYMYHNGDYLEKDSIQSDKWLMRASKQGYQDRIDALLGNDAIIDESNDLDFEQYI